MKTRVILTVNNGQQRWPIMDVVEGDSVDDLVNQLILVHGLTRGPMYGLATGKGEQVKLELEPLIDKCEPEGMPTIGEIGPLLEPVFKRLPFECDEWYLFEVSVKKHSNATFGISGMWHGKRRTKRGRG